MFAPFFILFGLMATGFASRKIGWLDENKNKGLGNIVVNIAFPTLLISSMIEIEMHEEVFFEFLYMVVISGAFFFFFALLAKVFNRIASIPQDLRSMVEISLFSSNNAFMGLPITIAFFGQEGLILMVANNLSMNVAIFSYGIYILKRNKAACEGTGVLAKTSFLSTAKQIFNPMISAIILGLIISLSGFARFIPDALIQLLSILGSLATPLSMIYIGVTLYNSSFSALFKNPLILKVSLIRLTIFASITFAILTFLPIPPLMAQILFLVAVLPSASIVPVISAQYGSGSYEAVNIVVLSTLLSLIITPLGVYIALAFL